MLPALCNDRRQGRNNNNAIGIGLRRGGLAGAWLWRDAVALRRASPAGAQALGLAAMQPGSLNHTTATAIAKVMKEKGSLNTLVQPTAGESVLIPFVGRGEADFGIANSLEVIAATEGGKLPSCG